jgi:hypothetical protein
MALVFPPKASPTYMPLGVASLVAYLKKECPECSPRVLDINLDTWRWLAEEDPDGVAMLGFFNGTHGRFFDPADYAAHARTWNRIRARMTRLSAEAIRYVDQGTAAVLFTTFLDRQVQDIMATDPELVGFSMAFLDQVPFALALAGKIHDMSRSRKPGIIFGGAAMNALKVQELLIACPYVAGVVTGEGESGLAELCSGREPEEIPGLVFRQHGGIRKNPNPVTLSLKGLPAPDFSEFRVHDYFNPQPVIPVLYSRGCDWRKCRFCVHNASFAGYRAKGAAAFVLELAAYQARHGVSHFYSADQYIRAVDLERIADVILDMKLNIKLHVLGRPLDDWTPSRAEKLARAGCTWIGWGVESGSPRLLDLINKGTNVDTIKAALRNTHQAGISNLAMMIFGLPTGTDQDLRCTFRFMEDVYGLVGGFSTSAFVLWAQAHFGRNAAKYGLHVTGNRLLLKAGGVPVHSHRLDFKEISPAGELIDPRGPVELAAWDDRKAWLGDRSFLENLPCEHYFLYVSRKQAGGFKPIHPGKQAA